MANDTPLTEAELDRLNDFLTSEDAPENTMDMSMLDGYLAAVASDPNLIMPDQMLRWVWADETDMPETGEFVNLILRLYQATNNALNDGNYTPRFTDPHAWCRGYVIGVSANTAWAPLPSTMEGLMTTILSLCDETDVKARENAVETLKVCARRIHKFWVDERWNDLHSDDMVDVVIDVASAITMAEANRLSGAKQWLH